jgi:hypothetical protein
MYWRSKGRASSRRLSLRTKSRSQIRNAVLECDKQGEYLLGDVAENETMIEGVLVKHDGRILEFQKFSPGQEEQA